MTEEREKRAIGFLGLCMKAGQLVSGQEQCVQTIRAGQAALALLDGAASDNTKKRVTDACAAHDTPLYTLGAGALGRSIGRSERMVAALKPGGMADRLAELLNDNEDNRQYIAETRGCKR